jgi:hypothetical protein
LRHWGEHAYPAPHSAMMNPFQPVKKIEVRRFTALPAKFRTKRRTAWSDPNRQGAPVDSFLEGPSFDRQGNLWCVDIPYSRIFRIDRKGGRSSPTIAKGCWRSTRRAGKWRKSSAARSAKASRV